MPMSKKIMKPLLVLIILITAGVNAHARFKFGVIGTAGLGLNFYEPYNIWPGLVTGGGFTGEFYIFKSSAMSFEPNILYTYDAYRMNTDPETHFDPNDEYLYPLVISHNIRYGGYVNFYLNKSYSFRLGIGFIAAYTFAGKYGMPYQEEKFDLTMLGHDYYVSLKTGYLLSPRKLSGAGAISGGNTSYIPIELVIDYCLTVRPAHLFNISLRTGFVFDI